LPVGHNQPTCATTAAREVLIKCTVTEITVTEIQKSESIGILTDDRWRSWRPSVRRASHDDVESNASLLHRSRRWYDFFSFENWTTAIYSGDAL
jgi:hypothetical protein